MTIRARFPLSFALLAALVLTAFASTATAASPVAKDGKIHACYKAKGKAKGTLRLVRNGKVRCPRKWKKVAWYANGGGFGTPTGVPGPTGPQGPQGERGLQGTAGNVVVEELENKVSELLTKVQSLESVLKGITNTDLKEAIAAVPAVDALCTQADALTEQSNGLGTALSGLSTVVDTLTVMGLPSVPTALPPFECP
ncbi:MAG: hypothetical protein E6G51_00165 [Actinobacteria bacterium]|nr:MAG: hypothetical protein E6G51_00165 [Actinomycetota bacterium]